MKQKILIAILILSLVLLFGCQTVVPNTTNNNNNDNTNLNNANTGNSNVVPVQSNTSLFSIPNYDNNVNTKSFASKEEYLAFIKENSGSSNNYYSGYRGGVMMEKAVGISAPSMVSSVASDSSSGNSGISSPTGFSTTNNQVASVDEADILKTDGKYIYTISGNNVFIVKAYPGEDSRVVSTLTFDETPSNLFIYKDKLAVFGNIYHRKQFDTYKVKQGMSYFKIYDISNIESPKLTEEYDFEGTYFNARMKDNYIYLITTLMPQYRIDYPTPLVFENGVQSSIPFSKIHYFDMPYQNPTFVNIHAINIADQTDSVNSESIVVDNAENLYMSNNNIYVTYTETINEWEIERKITMDVVGPLLENSDKQLIQKIKNADLDILSKYEKESKIYQIYSDFLTFMEQNESEKIRAQIYTKLDEELNNTKYFEYTIISKIGVNGKEITPLANGKVPGRILNQFSLDENQYKNKDVLRIATTLSQRWNWYRPMMVEDSISAKMIAPPMIQPETSKNNVFTLDENLQVLDSIEGLAETEQIYSTRFIDDKLYMVTFRQVDPLFVIDLSNPSDIKELGKLKIPGFSRYLHPYDSTTLIGIGQETDENGRIQGLKISLFDVSDFSSPKEIAKYVTQEKYASSTALYEHKAFLFSKEKDLLVIPAYSYDYSGGNNNYNGAFVFNISKSGIVLRGLVDHSSNTQYYWDAAVERSLYIEDLLYTKSRGLIRINALSDLHKVNNVELKEIGTTIPIY